MTMRWTVRRTLVPDPVDVLVEAPVDTHFGDLRDQLVAVVGAGPDDRVSVADATVAVSAVADDAVVGRGRLLDGAELVIRPPGPLVGPGDPDPVVGLVAVSGPDCGRVHPLRRGGTVLGRHRSADAVVDDPDVSRRHLRVVLSSSGAEVGDLGSTNGTTVHPPRPPGRPALPARAAPAGGPSVAAPLGSHVVAGATRFEVRALTPGHPVAGSHGERGDGTVVHAATARARPADREVVLRLPPSPSPRERRRIPWVTALVPLAVAVPLALWWGSPAFLLLGLTGPVMMIGAVLTDRRETRRRTASDEREHAVAVAAVRQRAAAAAADSADLRRHAHPDLDLVLRSARHRDTRLWERSVDEPGALETRVGTADLPGPVHLEGENGPAAGTPALAAVPLLVDLAGGLAVGGPLDWAAGVVRGVVGRLAVALPPDVLTVSLCAAGDESARWQWVHRLPHAGPPLRGPADLLDAASGDQAPDDVSALKTAPTRRQVVVVAGSDPAWTESVAELARRPDIAPVVLTGGPLHGHGCASVAGPAGETGTGIRIASPLSEVEGVADRVGAWWPERLSRALAPLRPAAAAGVLPEQVTLAELIRRAPPGTPHLPVTAAEVAARWDDPGRGPDTLAVPLAVGPAGVIVLDLVRDGPHALVAGTTGAGKSELLRSLVLGLAWCHPPEEVALLLVDFKGGATFAEAAQLPHTIGTVTDLDPSAAHRVLASLRAELRRRERVLAAAGATDLRDLRRTDGGRCPPRLVVVVDEFRVLADEAPDVLEGLVRVAVVGRSLGVHLVLATQRPAGVVSADIRANTSVRIALRVADPGESRDVVDVPDAASLPASTPGRAVLSRSGQVTVVQAARAAVARTGGRPVVRRVTSAVAPAPSPTGGGEERGETDDVERLVAACRRAVVQTGRTPATPPWLPPLPADLGTEADLPGDDRDDLPGPCLPLALLDLPHEQRRAGLHWRPAGDGPLVVVGGPRSGRTTALASLAVTAISAGLPVVIVTGDPGSAWPVGAVVVDRHDGDHVSDVLARLADRSGTAPVDWVCVLIDDADALLRWAVDRPRTADLLGAVIREAGTARIAVALAGGRELLVDRTSASGRVRVLLRPADPADAALAGVPSGALPREMPPGRCLAIGTGHGDVVAGQVPRPGPLPSPAPAVLAPVPLALPARVERAPAVAHSLTWPCLPLGVGLAGSMACQVSVDLSASSLLVVAGPAGSGRTTALRTLADGALAAGATVVLLHDGDLPPAWAPHRERGLRSMTTAAAHATLLDTASGDGGRPPLVLVVDDVDRAGPDAEEIAVAVAAAGAAVVAATTTSWLAGSFRGLAAEVRRRGNGLLLRPGRHDGRDILGVAIPGQESRLPGRGVLVRGGTATRVQVARLAAEGVHVRDPTTGPDGEAAGLSGHPG